jgi:hypothetical protein
LGDGEQGRGGEIRKMKNFAGKLKHEISRGLPGTEVQWALASSDRMIKDFPRTPRNDSKEAAVMI